MNVIYLNKYELPVFKEAALSRERLSKVFSSMKQGCIFVINEKDELIGYINDAIFKKSLFEEKITFCPDFNYIIADSDSEIIGSESDFKDDLKNDLLAVIGKNGEFMGAYIRTYPEELVAYDRLMLQVALASLPAFVDEFVHYLAQQGIINILVVGDIEDSKSFINIIKEQLSVSQYKEYIPELDNKRTLIVDLVYSKSYRTYELAQWRNASIAKLEDILADALVDSVIGYVNSRSANIYFIEGPMKEKLNNASNRWPSMFQDNSLAQCISKRDFLIDFCNGDEALVNWMTDPEHGVLAGARITSNGIHLLTADYIGEKCKCIDGVRLGENIVKNSPTIHMYGPCLTFGSCVPDDYTIQKYLCQLLKNNNASFNIANHGVKNGHSNLNDFLYIFNTEINPGDIIICMNAFSDTVKGKIISNGQRIHCSSDYLNTQDCDKMKFLDMSFHVNSVVNSYLSRYIFGVIHDAVTVTNVTPSNTVNNNSYLLESGKIRQIDSTTILSKGLLRSYVDYLKKNRRDIKEGEIVGSVLITANPITKGHEYLINYAKQNCDLLYVFIVEEDMFYFSTAERMMLVREIIKDPNVIIVTTGTLMTAKFTFPEYFTKDKACVQESANFMPELHFQIFGGVVAPLLGITKRFVGTEIPGSVTDVYNGKLMKYLPTYGVKVEIIERLERNDGHEVSASDTRRMIEAGEFDKLSMNLSEPVVNYIKKKWKAK